MALTVLGSRHDVWHFHLETAFCVHLGFLCQICQAFECDRLTKIGHREWGKHFSTQFYVDNQSNIFFLIVTVEQATS